jgi:hypothetical protein
VKGPLVQIGAEKGDCEGDFEFGRDGGLAGAAGAGRGPWPGLVLVGAAHGEGPLPGKVLGPRRGRRGVCGVREFGGGGRGAGEGRGGGREPAKEAGGVDFPRRLHPACGGTGGFPPPWEQTSFCPGRQRFKVPAHGDA